MSDNSQLQSTLDSIIKSLEEISAGNPQHNLENTSNDPLIQKLINTTNKVVNYSQNQLQHLESMAANNRNRLFGLIESMNQGIVMFNPTPEITIANAKIRRIIGKQQDQYLTLAQTIHQINQLIAGSEDNDTQDGSDLVAESGKGVWEKITFFEAIERVLQRGKTVRYPEVKIKKHYFEINFIPVMENQQNIIGGAIIFHDITELIQVDRMKTEFVSVASHQLRTPLTSMRLFIEMLINQQVGPLTEDQNTYLKNIEESTYRMIRIVNEFLNVSRLETGRLKIEPQMTELKAYIGDIVDKLQIIAKQKQVKLEFQPPTEDFSLIPIDQSLMHEVIKNLITNAISYSAPAEDNSEGKVIVKFSKVTTPDPPKDVDMDELESKFKHYQPPSDRVLASYFPDSYILITVSDNGMGIPEKSQPDIFKKFYRADNAIKIRSEGSGLGLYLVKMIVENSKGKIWFNSTPGKGTTFYLALPVYGMLPKSGEKSLA